LESPCSSDGKKKYIDKNAIAEVDELSDSHSLSSEKFDKTINPKVVVSNVSNHTTAINTKVVSPRDVIDHNPPYRKRSSFLINPEKSYMNKKLS
jgi:hypothetical protein